MKWLQDTERIPFRAMRRVAWGGRKNKKLENVVESVYLWRKISVPLRPFYRKRRSSEPEDPVICTTNAQTNKRIMWWALAFLSATLLGFYDSFKKASLKDNAVIPVLFLNTLFSSLILLPFAIRSGFGSWDVQKYILLKSCIVLASWLAGYFAMKHLPLTIVGPINATRPVMVLIGAMLLFGERLNAYQWIGVFLAAVSFFLLGRSGRKEGIDFRRNRWIACLILAAVIGAGSALYDRFLMAPADHGGAGLDRLQVLSWYNFYQCLMMGIMLLILWLPLYRRKGPDGAPGTTPFRWSWTIPCISLFLSGADFVYLWSLSDPDAMISVVSMIRRGSVVVSFLFGAHVFKEKNLKSKALDLAFVLLGMFFLYLGSR